MRAQTQVTTASMTLPRRSKYASRWSLAVSASLAVLLAACGSTLKDKDDNKSVAKLYEEAREEAAAILLT